ncbi:L-seryl-tRNA(Sec) kinase-like [Uloborus diversus]|uniref:L-seryl-tRNA(Sec) kinase-like n=1 Tax=Uloborus diversus TaxID=327109 RepID=UPI0024090966|nr:L-seryl-tRNA(Sec) kinase-like [Uloborus diversus]
MSCLVLVGGIVGCGKTNLINFFKSNKSDIFPDVLDRNEPSDTESTVPRNHFEHNSIALISVLIDDLCSIEEQAEMMKSLHGWRNFRADLLIAAEHFINLYKCSESIIHGPLSLRSCNLLEKIKKLNYINAPIANAIVFIEDNFYYRSMRYDWFQIAKRTNIGFCQVFLHCALNTAINRNSLRGYQIPEQKIKKMFNLMEYPDSVKYKWEKYSLKFDTAAELNTTSINPIVVLIKEATNDPAEVMINKDKVEAQSICSKNVIHQVDKIIRKAISKKISELKSNATAEDDLKSLIALVVNIRQDFLKQFRQGFIALPDDIVEKIKCLGIDCVEHECSEIINERFDKLFEMKSRKICCT